MLKNFARIAGIVFLLVGILGFLSENLLGLFHLSAVHNSIHLAFGIWGLLASIGDSGSRVFAKTVGVVYLLLGLVGFFVPGLFGLMHVGLSENILHLMIGIISGYIGFSSPIGAFQKLTKSA
jgi:hypothetical protein